MSLNSDKLHCCEIQPLRKKEKENGFSTVTNGKTNCNDSIDSL